MSRFEAEKLKPGDKVFDARGHSMGCVTKILPGELIILWDDGIMSNLSIQDCWYVERKTL